MTADEIRRLAAELGLDALGVTRAEAYVETERHIVERRARGLFADMKFTMAQPERSCHPESLLPGARSVVSAALCYWEPEGPLAAGRGPSGALHVVGRVRRAARTARRSRPGDRRDLPGARRREPARRPRGGRAERGRVLRQEHDADHPQPRVLGRARNARQRSRARVDAATRHRLRRLQDLHRRVPDRRARRAGHARRDEMPLVLDAGAARRFPRSIARGSAHRCTAATSARTSAPGTAAWRSAGRPGADHGGARRSRRVARVRRR